MKRYIFVVLTALFLLSLAACAPKSPSDCAHALAVGVDAGENGGYIYSFLIPSGDGGRGRVVSVSAESLGRALSLAGTEADAKISVSHAYIILISLDAAEGGLSPLSESLSTGGLRPLTPAAVTRAGAAERLLSISESASGNLPDRLETLSRTPASSYAPRVTAGDITGGAPALTLPLYDGRGRGDGAVILKDGAPPRICSRGDALILGAVTGRLPADFINADGIAGDGVYLRPRRPPRAGVDISGDAPVISVSLFFYCRTDGRDDIPHIQKRLEDGVSAFLYRCAKEYKADVFGFSQMIRPRFLTLDALRAYGFENRFPRSRFNVTVSLSPDGGSE